MLKMLRCRQVLLMSILVLFALGGCIRRQGGVGEPVLQEPGFKWLVPSKLLEGTELKRVWENKVPLKRSESLERLFIFGNCIYALSDRNYMVSLDRETGNVVFSRSVADAGLPVIGLELYRDELFSVIGNKLVEINLRSGSERSTRSLGCSVICPAARNDSHFYIGCADRRMHTLRGEDKVELFGVAAEDESMIVSIVADDDFVVFATDGGDCIGIRPDAPKRLWQFNAEGGIVGPIVRDGESLFFASEDTNIYKLNILTGEFVWKFGAGAVLESSPQVAREFVYQYVRDKGLAALEKGSGKLLWLLPEGIGLLAEAGGKSYVLTTAGNLVAMDNKKVKQLYKVNLSDISRYGVNTADSKIYIADSTGRIACLMPAE